MTPFRFPTQSLEDVELIEEVPVRRTGVTSRDLEAAYGSVHPQSAEHRLVWQEPVVARDGALSMRRVYRKLPGVPLAGEMLKQSTLGARATVTVQEVAAGTPCDEGVTVLESVVEPKDAQTARKRTVAMEWPLLTGKLLDAETRTPVSVEKQVVPAATVLDEAGPLVVDQKLELMDKWRSVRVVTSLDRLPEDYQELKSLDFRFPGLFYDFDTATHIVSYRHAISCTVPARVVVTFGYAAEDLDFYVIRPVSWSFPSGFSASGVLTNGEVIEYPVGTFIDPSSASALPLPSFVTVPASSPTRAEYEAAIGTYVTVKGASERWKGGVWRTERWQVKLA
jgi:hypothetical protein